MDQEWLDWLQLLGRWLHITTAVTWIGSSIFFMWLDRSFERNEASQRPGHIGELWMVHGGGFYHVEKLEMGPTPVPKSLHWFKWESYWTWMSGIFLLSLIFFTGSGTFLLDADVSKITFPQALALSLGSIFVSWFAYDFLWESSLTKKAPMVGHVLTIAWLGGASYLLCHTLSGRAAYLMIGAMMGTWMTANVFMRIIPRQLKMVEAAKRGESVNKEWSKNAKNRSTHNTYFTLPVIFIMLSNHFPATYGHDLNWLILLLMCAAGAAIREYFVVRLAQPARAKTLAAVGALIILGVMVMTKSPAEIPTPESPVHAVSVDSSVVPTPAVGEPCVKESDPNGGELCQVPVSDTEKAIGSETSSIPAAGVAALPPSDGKTYAVSGVVRFEGLAPEPRKLTMAAGCVKSSQAVFSDEVLIRQGKLQNVLVRITKGHETLPVGTVPSKAVEIDQVGCVYRPRFSIARVNQEVVFINSDSIFHNVRSLSKENPAFNLAMPLKNQRITKQFQKPEIFLQTKCSVHPWMGAFIAVSDHPYLALTDVAGAFQIDGLPTGEYEVEFVHEVFGVQKKVFQIANAPARVEAVFKRN